MSLEASPEHLLLFLFLISLFLTFFSGLAGLFFRSGKSGSQWIATILHILGSLAGLLAVFLTFLFKEAKFQFFWSLPCGTISFCIDRLSAFFLLPVFLILGLGSIYGHGYWAEKDHPSDGRKLRFFYGALTAGLILVMLAGDAWFFLIGWEIVGLSGFFLVSTESENQNALRAAWIYLIATHAATLVLLAMFGAMYFATGTWQFQGISTGSPLMVPILILALVGFGIKAGIMPFHVWLPEAHAAAPSHVSATLSGIVLKMGIYGLVRILTLVPQQDWFGLTLLCGGILSGVLGVVFALAQHDLKRLLAYHSIENIGIILIGLGAGILGRNEKWGALAMAGGLLHVWNHAFFKSLLFFSAGSVVHSTATRTMDEMGGLLKSLPLTGFSFLIGAVAICGLPPLNGFVSEWLIYVASFQNILRGTDVQQQTAILAAPALALIGALAVACFVKAFSTVFLGNPRTNKNFHFSEPASMKGAMMVLVLACVVMGIWPRAIVSPLVATTVLLTGNSQATVQIRNLFENLSVAALILVASIFVAATISVFMVRRFRQTVTWDCGYAAPTSRMQYTSSSFAQPLVELFRWALRPDVHKKVDQTFFPSNGAFETHVPDPVLERFLIPALSYGQRLVGFARFLQAGRIQLYILYIIATLLILLAWSR